ncbi:hypothetical protein GCM10025864_11290 [Luteimicrobium album]|uniref:Uncharacterized protein n=1 Tax=Luteimicrobium album TaxID=1054550 RepID=A0ABQ6I0S0_9MICO|nr:hypothetical protein [Luteimicrobium album]GMA23370.1 hypothetical protein GCM10025864_11290 [Luteimicrobium album]
MTAVTGVTGGRADAWLAGALWLVVGAGFGFVISVVGLATVPAALVVAALLPTVGPRWALAGLVAVAAAAALVIGVGERPSSTGVTGCQPEPGVTCVSDSGSHAVTTALLGVAALLAVLAVVLVVVAARSGVRRPPAQLAFLALSGAGVLPLVVAYLNREGPGDVCTAYSGGQCVAGTEEWSPWPWLVVGVGLVVAGVVLSTVAARRR